MLKCGIVLFFVFCLISVSTSEDDVRSVEPEELEKLLEEGNYEEFSKLMRIDDVRLVVPKDDNSDPMYHDGVPFGDILIPKGEEELEEGEESERAVLNFRKYGGNKWPNGVIPYAIANNHYDYNQRNTITNAINDFNAKNTGTRFVPRSNQRDYVMIFSGNGCYSYLGKIGNQQALSLQSNGCVHHAIVQHEMIHAVGFTHEQNRPDRDNFVRVLWENIPQEWHSQYQKGNSDDWVTTTDYDYYSVMHYGMRAPGTGRRAFQILRGGIDERYVGQRGGMTGLDVQKIRNAYR
ncbi:low choriolytic enzyme-like [Uloborus diversus]|uniref:low choriolytic enzyme-like n=1 Tax=Uloborus diversus TaxID=327109 RepID=UPI00240956D1|nr:low choriolytic enzyme-like [Uloborus diversus]